MRENFNIENGIQEQKNLEQGKTKVDLLLEKKKKLEEEVFNYDIENLDKLKNLSETELQSHYKIMIKRIFKETPALKEIEDTVGRENLFNGFKKPKFPIEVNFDQSRRIQYELEKRGIKYEDGQKDLESVGLQIEEGGGLLLADKAPNIKEIWEWLVNAEIEPKIDTLDHEIIHYYNEKSKKGFNLAHLKRMLNSFGYHVKSDFFWRTVEMADFINKKIVRTFSESRFVDLSKKIFEKKIKLTKKDKEIAQQYSRIERQATLFNEVMAYKANQVYNSQDQGSSSIINKLAKDTYGFKKSGDIDKIIIASQAVDRMRVLGLSDKKMAGILAQTEYNEDEMNLPLVDKKINELLKKQDIDLEEVDYRVDLMRVKSRVNMLSAAKIAQEELTKLTV